MSNKRNKSSREGQIPPRIMEGVKLQIERDQRQRAKYDVVRWIALVVMVVATIGTSLVMWQVIDPERKYDSVKARFFAEIDTQTGRGFIHTLEDVEMVRLGISKEGKNEKLMSSDLEGLLSEYLVTAGSESNSDDTTQIAKAEVIKNIITVLRTEKPFSVLPEEDQLTAIELKKSIESEDKESSLSRLEVLSRSLGKNISTLSDRAGSGYRWAIIGVIVACAGLVWAVIISIYRRGRASDVLGRELGEMRYSIADLDRRLEEFRQSGRQKP